MLEIPSDLTELRAHRGLMSKDLTNQVLKILHNPNLSESELLTALIIAWLSNDTDLITSIRAILAASDLAGR